jgi:hypothetical protein
MIVEAVQTVRDIFHSKDRVTIYKTLIDEKSNKTVVEIVQFLYSKNGSIEGPSKGSNIDLKA